MSSWTRSSPRATAARGPQSIEDLLADLTVIDRDEIARSGADGLAKLLSRHHGIEIVQNGGPASTSGVFIRGANRGQTVVLLDGIRLESSTAGAASLEAIPLDQIERIEILRGPQATLYGSNTIGTAKDDGYPVIEDDVWIGAGARILGPIRIGARSRIGANAVVVTDVPPDSVAIGIPAKVRPRTDFPPGTEIP